MRTLFDCQSRLCGTNSSWRSEIRRAGAKRKQKEVPKEYLGVGRFWGKIGKLKLYMEGVATVDAAEVFRAYGCDALSSRGRVKKYLYDAAGKFSFDEYAGLY
ncbi:hypothetical protein TSACC_21403 [Terrimicrobium sacchariphilum]|uniref:Uncharacterized protein n=1 Tax=Terrimicrobium sacchariphilum TaxID=690879 RepID=A0A146G8I3_TERSA|nr:hypothetical protein [Terrimicrobium sacchariphilum]GAT32998.1 hypothetical protein TSACC_21403 [Terrimicrobium sacchariphilum]